MITQRQETHIAAVLSIERITNVLKNPIFKLIVAVKPRKNFNCLNCIIL